MAPMPPLLAKVALKYLLNFRHEPPAHGDFPLGAAQRIKASGLNPPSGSAPAANYVNAERSDNLLFIAGKAPLLVPGMPE